MRHEVQSLFSTKQDRPLLSIFYTAGYPTLDATYEVFRILDSSNVDFIEIGMPFSDPIADGPVIQNASSRAIANGMTPTLLLEQIREIRTFSRKPIFVMGYFNPVFQFGVERFLGELAEAQVDGLIVPDLPVLEYERKYQELFIQYGISNIFLVTPLTPDERIRRIDALSTTFIYVVSTPSITGGAFASEDARLQDLKHIHDLSLRHPLIVGFGIGDGAAFESVTKWADGAIVGSAFLRALEHGVCPTTIRAFLDSLRNKGDLP